MSDSISFWILFASAPAIVKRNDLQTILSFIEMTQHCSFPLWHLIQSGVDL